jgi:hypothetical protein
MYNYIEQPKAWANLHPCHKGTPAGHFPTTFWCGNGTICEDKAPLGQFIGLHPDNVMAIAGRVTSSPLKETNTNLSPVTSSAASINLYQAFAKTYVIFPKGHCRHIFG